MMCNPLSNGQAILRGLKMTLAMSLSDVRVTHGANDGVFSITGMNVASVRRRLATPYNIPDDAQALINGVPVDLHHRLMPGDHLEFTRMFGWKSTLSPEELAKLDLPEEVSTEEAGQILAVTKHTVIKLLEDGLLEWRNAAPPSSSRPVYRISTKSVMALRTAYRRGGIRTDTPEGKPQRRPRAGSPKPYTVKHIRRKDSP